MKKIVDFLEQKIQWMVFAIAVAYVGYMAWLYLISSPIKTVVGSQTLRPGEVDPYILDQVGNDLEKATNETGVPPNIQKPPSYVKTFVDAINYDGKRMAPSPYAIMMFPHGDIPMSDDMPAFAANDAAAPVPGRGGGPAPKQAPVGAGVVERLPVIPPARVVSLRTGLTNVSAAVPGAPGRPAADAGLDKSWVTVRFEIDPATLAKEWDACKIPANLKTSYLQVILQRQQLQSDGSWGAETVIAPLAFHQIQQFPDPASPKTSQVSFLTWAAQHTADILQPSFYTRLKGDFWAIPGEELPAAPAVAAFNPQPYLKATKDEIDKLSPEQRQAVYKAQEAAKPQNAGRRGPAPRAPARGPAPRPTPRRGGGGGEQGLAPNLMPKTALYLSLQPAADEPMDAPPEAPAGPAAAPVAGPPVAMAGQGKFSIPNGDFEPHALKAGAPVIGWAHDETAEPGATYRYRVIYKMKNPVFARSSDVKVLKLADMLALESAPSEWSEQIEVPSMVSFFIVSGQKGTTQTFSVQVFRWKGGEPKAKLFNVGPGDLIGTVEGDVDYTTGWSVVDVRNDPARNEESYMLLMDPQGYMRKRDSQTDTKSPTYQRMKEQAAAAVPPPPKPGDVSSIGG